MKKRTKIILSLCLALLIIIGIAGYAYISDYYHADEAAITAMSLSTDEVRVETDGEVTWFIPEEPIAGMIFYPGGKVEAAAYAPLLYACAERGILCALVEMPANLAVLDKNAADGLPSEFPELEHWYMAGHSLGGAMAAGYVADHSGDFDGLILLAAYSTEDLGGTKLRVLSVYGSEDKVLDMEKYGEYLPNLPQGSDEIIISGGCHAQFGSYGIQDGDGTPTISGDEQQSKTAELIYEFITGGSMA